MAETTTLNVTDSSQESSGGQSEMAGFSISSGNFPYDPGGSGTQVTCMSATDKSSHLINEVFAVSKLAEVRDWLGCPQRPHKAVPDRGHLVHVAVATSCLRDG